MAESVVSDKPLDKSKGGAWKDGRIPVLALSVADGDSQALFCCSLLLYATAAAVDEYTPHHKRWQSAYGSNVAFCQTTLDTC